MSKASCICRELDAGVCQLVRPCERFGVRKFVSVQPNWLTDLRSNPARAAQRKEAAARRTEAKRLAAISGGSPVDEDQDTTPTMTEAGARETPSTPTL